MSLRGRFTLNHPKRKITAAVVIALLATAISFGMHFTPGIGDAMSGLDNTLYDAFYKFRDIEDRTGGPIIIVTADDNSVKQLASLHHIPFPFPRALWGGAAQYVESIGAKAVVFDITFELPSNDDEDFADELDSLRIPLVMATSVEEDGKLEAFSPKTKKGQSFGAANISNDKIVRDYQVIVKGTPSVALRTVQMLGAQPRLADRSMRLHYYGPTDRLENGRKRYTYQYVSAWAVFTASQAPEKAASLGLTPEMFRNKIVLFGYTGRGMYDLKSSPLSKEYPGVELHATAIDNLLNGQIVETAGAFPRSLVALAAALLAAMGVLIPRSVILKSAAAVFAAIVVVFFAVALFRANQIRWIPMSGPLLALILAVISSFAWSYLTEDRQRRLILKALTQYLSPEIAAEIERNPSALKLGGERREMTVLFSDIQGFTDLSESMASEKLSAVLNYYLGEMSSVILDNNGTLDKYIGDAIMTFWSAPIIQPDHAIRACRSALAMRDREAKIQPALAALGAKGMLTRIGINTGPMVFGNMGSPHKFSYSVLGDSVNLGSRLEGANKFYGSRILISESTAMLAKGKFILRKLDVLRVKGKREPLAVYELLGEGEADPDTRTRITGYEQAFGNYQAQDWDHAQDILAKLRTRFPDDQPVAALMKRIEKLRHDPPRADWDGVYVAKEK